ncbi:MerR family transcriptional regulator [Fusobacterium animalis]|jgi:transcriptional regulator|uniref:MerR family transcriptional regulator n=1 Tax=Fusobacterium animalis TaxID=76859 RepID=UPI0030CD10A3
MEYSIGEFSKLTGLSIHTLRYYEYEQLIVPMRNKNNIRRYSDKDIAWIDFIKRLKDTGMPIKKIKEYAKLRSKGDITLSKRMEMLIQHYGFLEKQISILQEHKEKLNQKIKYYQVQINLLESE